MRPIPSPRLRPSGPASSLLLSLLLAGPLGAQTGAPDSVLATVGPRTLGPAEFVRQWSLAAARVVPPDTTREAQKVAFLEALVERELLTLAALRSGFELSQEQQGMLGAIRLIEMRVAYYRLRIGSGADEGTRTPDAADTAAAGTGAEAASEASRYRTVIDELLAPLAPAYVDSNLQFLVASYQGIPPPVQRGPEGVRIDFRLRLPDLAPADTGRVLVETRDESFSVQRFLWHWGQLSPIDRVPPASAEQARLWTERFLAQGPMDADARARGYDRLPEVERAVQRQRDAFAGEWYFRREILTRVDTSETALRARWSQHPQRYFGATTYAHHRVWYPSFDAAIQGMALCRSGAAWNEVLAQRFPPETNENEIKEFRDPRELVEDSPDTTLLRWFSNAAPGEVFGPREMQGRWWIYRYLEERPGRVSTYAEARSFVRDEILAAESERLLRALFEDLASEFPVVLHPERLASVRVEDPFEDRSELRAPAGYPRVPSLRDMQ